MSPEAAAVFVRAEAPGPGAALVVDLDAFEHLGLAGKGPEEGFSICAYGNLDSDDTWDVWIIDQEGEPENLSNDLE